MTARVWILVWVTLVLVLAACTLVPWLFMALDRDDVEASESPLLLAVARQLLHGPRELYGPYGAGNPLVLIHAPLYYRLAALFAWPLARTGLAGEQAALVAGRTISFAAWVATLAGAFVLARLQGAPRIAGWWAVLLAAATPVFGGLIVEVRPDMLGVAIQTWGVVLLLGALEAARPDRRKIVMAFVCFAAAACVKQQLLATAAASTLLLAAAWRQKRIDFATLVIALLCNAAVIFAYYGAEFLITDGRIAQAVYKGARACAVVNPATSPDARNLLLVLCWKCIGLVLLSVAAALAWVETAIGRGARFAMFAGNGLIAILTSLAVVQVFAVNPWVSASIVTGLLATIVGFLPLGAWALARSWRRRDLDAAFALYFLAELALTICLFRLTSGAWFNYAVQAVIFAAILVARALASATEKPLRVPSAVGIALAVLAVPAFALTDVKETLARRRVESVLIQTLFASGRLAKSSVFFVDRPGLNRVHGRRDLVYDPWLYPVFESIHLAELRSVWLEPALASGPVRVVVATSAEPRIDGLTHTLPELGYTSTGTFGPWFVWQRPP